jgi:hypothetical protein
MLSASQKAKSKSGAVVGGLVVVMLAAIAIALPPSPILVAPGVSGVGSLESASLFSGGIAEQNAAHDFGYLAIDLSRVSTDSDALWRQQFDLLSSRRLPIWAWVDASRCSDASRCGAEFLQLLNDLAFAGIYLYGEDAAKHATQLRTMRSGRSVIVVTQSIGDPKTNAVMLDLEQYLASASGQYAHPVLVADQLTAAQVETAVKHAKTLAGDDGSPTLLVARVPIR